MTTIDHNIARLIQVIDRVEAGPGLDEALDLLEAGSRAPWQTETIARGQDVSHVRVVDRDGGSVAVFDRAVDAELAVRARDLLAQLVAEQEAQASRAADDRHRIRAATLLLEELLDLCADCDAHPDTDQAFCGAHNCDKAADPDTGERECCLVLDLRRALRVLDPPLELPARRLGRI